MDLFFKALTRAYQVSKEKIDDALHQIVPEPLLAPQRVTNESNARQQIALALEKELSTVAWVNPETEEEYLVLSIFPQDTGESHTLKIGIISVADRQCVLTLNLTDFLKNFIPCEKFITSDA